MSRLPFSASCTDEVAAIRAEPRDDAEQVTQALKGEPLAVEERRDGWARIRTAYGYPGWMKEEALAPGVVTAWLVGARDGDVVAQARLFLGSPYLWGGMSRRGIDCSGLVHMAYRGLGRLVPRDADDQEDAAEPVPDEQLRPGDLITYGDERRADHVAFWVGDGRILHSTAGRGVVEEEEPEQLRARRRRLVRL